MLKLRVDYVGSITGKEKDRKPHYLYVSHLKIKGNKAMIGDSQFFILVEDIIEISMVDYGERDSVKKRLDLIERKVRDAFNDEEIDKADGTFNRQRDAYRKAQVLADIFAIFEYDGATIGDE